MGRSFFRELLDDDSYEDEIIIKLLTSETSQRKRHRYIDCNHLVGHKRLYDDYFVEEPVYPPKVFRRRFRMRHSLFLRILSKVEAHESYFIQKRNNAVQLYGNGCIVVIFVSQLLFWKQWLHMIFGYDTHFLDYLGQIMILMCWSGPCIF